MRRGILNFPFLSMQLKNQGRVYPKITEPILNLVESLVQPGKRTTAWVKVEIYTDNEATSIIQPLPLLENDQNFHICAALSKTQNNKQMIQIITFLDHPYTLKKGMHMANFSILTRERRKHIKLVNPIAVMLLLNNPLDDAIHYTNSLLKTTKTEEINDTYCFRTPQNAGDDREHTPI